MTENKFTDEEVIRALECCKDADCLNCPRWSEEWTSGMCADFLPSLLDLINRQKAEIERLTVELVGMRGAANSYKMHYDNAKAEIERLKETLDATIAGQETLQKHIDAARAEAVKEFAVRLGQEAELMTRLCDGKHVMAVALKQIFGISEQEGRT